MAEKSKPDEAVEEPLPTPPPEDLDRVRLLDISGVAYTGRADVKRITADDLNKLGIENPKGDLEWRRDSQHFVPKEQFNAATLDWLLTQPNFSAVHVART